MATVKKAAKSSPMVDQDRQWKIDSALSTINRYNELMADKSLMADVQKKAQEQLNTVNKFRSGGMLKKAAPKKAVKKVVAKKVAKKK